MNYSHRKNFRKMGSVPWLVASLLVLITKLAYARAHGMDFKAELGFNSGFGLWGSDEDKELEAHSASEFLAWRSGGAKKIPVNVDIFGAVGDGIADDTMEVIQSAQQIHFTISHSKAIRVSGIRVKSPPDSPNTDGIHVSESTDVSIQKDLHIDFSIGSLGKDNSVSVVMGVVLDTAILTGTTNGLRIKTWQGGSGYVRAIRFENVKMNDVENPIIIDQFYCDSPTACKNQTAAVKISQVMYRNISGTSRTSKAMKFACSDTVPCSNIVLNNINLERENGTAETFCNCAMGFDYGFVRPEAACLSNGVSSQCNGGSLSHKIKHEPVHSEL